VAYRWGVGGSNPHHPRNSEVLTRPSRIPCSVENTSVTTSFANSAKPLTRGLPHPDDHSLCPLSSTEFVEPSTPQKKSWVRHWPLHVPPRRSTGASPVVYLVALSVCKWPTMGKDDHTPLVLDVTEDLECPWNTKYEHYRTQQHVKMHCKKLCRSWIFRNSPYKSKMKIETFILDTPTS
jgi:hypothetical protein